MNFPSVEINLEKSLRMHSSKRTVFPLPVGAEITIFMSERKQAEKHSLCNELKYLQVEGNKSRDHDYPGPSYDIISFWRGHFYNYNFGKVS